MEDEVIRGRMVVQLETNLEKASKFPRAAASLKNLAQARPGIMISSFVLALSVSRPNVGYEGRLARVLMYLG